MPWIHSTLPMSPRTSTADCYMLESVSLACCVAACSVSRMFIDCCEHNIRVIAPRALSVDVESQPSKSVRRAFERLAVVLVPITVTWLKVVSPSGLGALHLASDVLVIKPSGFKTFVRLKVASRPRSLV